MDDFNKSNEYEFLIKNGFRRSHNILYNQVCANCNLCKSIRINVKKFTLSKSNKRILNKNKNLFIKKLSEYGNGIALVLNSTDTIWFQEYGLKKADAMFLLKGRPKFTRLDMTEVSIMRGVVLFAYGKDNALKLKECGLKGYYVPLNVA